MKIAVSGIMAAGALLIHADVPKLANGAGPERAVDILLEQKACAENVSHR